MATELGVGYISLVPSARGFGRSVIREAGTAGTSASTAFGSRFVSGMAGIAKRAGQAFTIGLGAASFFAIRTAADFEQTRIAFEGILGDTGKAKTLLDSLRDFATKTPFEFTGLADSAKQLLAVGFASEDIIPTMTTLGNVAATLGVGEAEIAGVVRALGQMKGKGKASAEELQQISEQVPGFSAIKAIAEDMGVSTAEAFDLMAKGAIPADAAIESILNGMETFPGSAGAMERQSKTLNGVISTLKDTLSGAAIDFITPYLPQLSRAVTAFGGFITNTALPALKSFIEFIGDEIGPVIDKFKAFWYTLTTGFTEDEGTPLERFALKIRELGETVRTIVVETIIPAIQSFAALVKDNLGPVLAAVAVGFGAWALSAASAAVATIAAISPLVLIVAAIAAVAAGLVYAYTHFEGFRDIVDAVAAFLDDVVWPAIQAFARGIADTFRALVGWVREHWAAIQEAISHVMRVVEEVVGVAIDAISALWRAWGDDLFAIAKTIWENIRETVENAINLVRSIIETVVALINGDWGKAWDGIKGILAAIWDQITNIVETAINLVKSTLGGVLSTISEVWSGIWVGIAGAFSAVWETIKDVAGDAIDWVMDKIETVMGAIRDVIEAFQRLPNLSPTGLRVTDEQRRIIEGSRAMGGPVNAGSSYIVGERGPELFTPGSSGGITANHGLGGPVFYAPVTIVSSAGSPRDLYDETLWRVAG